MKQRFARYFSTGRRHYLLDDEDPAGRCHGTATAVQDAHTAFIVKAVNDTLQDVGVSALGHGHEEVPGYELTAVGQPSRLNGGSGPLDDGCQLKQDAVRLRIARENRGQQYSLSATDIHDLAERREVVV